MQENKPSDVVIGRLVRYSVIRGIGLPILSVRAVVVFFLMRAILLVVKAVAVVAVLCLVLLVAVLRLVLLFVVELVLIVLLCHFLVCRFLPAFFMKRGKQRSFLALSTRMSVESNRFFKIPILTEIDFRGIIIWGIVSVMQSKIL